jgi:hypothetical protein
VQLQSRMVTPVITQEQLLRQGYARANWTQPFTTF